MRRALVGAMAAVALALAGCATPVAGTATLPPASAPACAWHAGAWQSVPCHYVGPGTHGQRLDLVILRQPTSDV